MNTQIDTITWVAAVDGGKAVLWRNEGFDDQPNLKLVEQHALHNPPAHDHGSDRPGRIAKGTAGRAAVGQSNGHDQAKQNFVQSVIARLNQAAEKGEFGRLLLLAPAHVLGEARPYYSAALSKCLIERERDVVHQPTAKIDAQVVAALTAPAVAR